MKTEIFNVPIKDRHCNPEIYNFTNKVAACTFARETSKKYCRFEEDYNEHDFEDEDPSDWILLINYTCKGDYVRVSKGELK